MMRTGTIVALISIFIIGFYATYTRFSGSHQVYRIPLNLVWVGVVDRDYDRNISIDGIINGEDVLLVVDFHNPAFQALLANSLNPNQTPRTFELADFDFKHDGVINKTSPLYPFLYIISFLPINQGYVVKKLSQSGIRAIMLKHVDGNKNHQVILSNDSTRTLYEINRPGGLSIITTPRHEEIVELK